MSDHNRSYKKVRARAPNIFSILCSSTLMASPSKPAASPLNSRPLLVRNTSEFIRRDSFGSARGSPAKTTVVEIVEEQCYPGLILEVFKEGGQRLKAGTLDTILDWLLQKKYDDPRTLKAFFLCYRIMIEPNELWNRLVGRFPFERNQDPAAKADEDASEISRKAIIDFVLNWIETSPTEDFFSIEGKMAAPLWKQTQEFLKKLQINKYREFSAVLVEKIQSIAVPLQELQARAAKELAQEDFGGSGEAPVADTDRSSLENVTVLDLKPEEIVACLTAADFSLFQRVRMNEFLLKKWETDKVRSKIAEITQRFDRIAFWVATEILNEELDLYRRKAVLEHMIFAAEKCFLLNNFNAAMAILAGLNNGAVTRLKLTWAELPYRSKGIYDKLDELMSPLQNFKNYRELLANARHSSKPTFPYLALILRDITFAHENPSKLPNPAAKISSSASGTSVSLSSPVKETSSSSSALSPPASPMAVTAPTDAVPSTPPPQSVSPSKDISPQSSSSEIVEEKLLNFNKIEILGRQILEVKHFQSLPFTQLVEVDDVIQSYFRDLAIVSKEEELYRMSYKAEPRATSTPPTINSP